MGLLDAIKSLLGIGGPPVEPSAETNVTVEREPDAESEAAVKGDLEEPPGDGRDDTAEAGGADPGDAGEAEADPGAGASVEEIKGIGPAYGERLAGVGVETVADLAAADPEELAGRTELGESRLRTWVDRAREFEE